MSFQALHHIEDVRLEGLAAEGQRPLASHVVRCRSPRNVRRGGGRVRASSPTAGVASGICNEGITGHADHNERRGRPRRLGNKKGTQLFVGRLFSLAAISAKG